MGLTGESMKEAAEDGVNPSPLSPLRKQRKLVHYFSDKNITSIPAQYVPCGRRRQLSNTLNEEPPFTGVRESEEKRTQQGQWQT